MIVIGAVAFVIVRHTATSGAIRQAKELAQLAGRGIAEPQITPGVLRGDAAALASLDRTVRERILKGRRSSASRSGIHAAGSSTRTRTG